MNPALAPASLPDSASQQPIFLGASFLDGARRCVIVDFVHRQKGIMVRLDVDGELIERSWRDLLCQMSGNDPFEGAHTAAVDECAIYLVNLPDAERIRVARRICDLIECIHGDRWGTLHSPHPHWQPKAEYDPAKTRSEWQRLVSKSAELGGRESGTSPQRLHAQLTALRTSTGAGLRAIVRRKYWREYDPLFDLDSVVLTTAKKVALELAAPENGSVVYEQRLALTLARLEQKGYTKAIPEHVQPLLIGWASAGLGLDKKGKTRASQRIQPPGPQGSKRALYPGHIVDLDAYSLNIIGRTALGERIRFEVLTATDRFTRMVVGLRLVVGTHKADDTLLLLFDVLSGHMRRTDWKTGEEFAWTGMPAEIHLDPETIRWGIRIDNVQIDLGMQFNNQDLLPMLAANDIGVFFAPPRKGPAKGGIESLQRNYTYLTQGIPGDKGRSPDNRGEDSPQRVLPTKDRVERLLYEFINEVYNRRKHRRLLDPEEAHYPLSPVDVLVRFMRTHGTIYVPLRPDFRYGFLPHHKVQATKEGLRLNGKRYESTGIKQKWRREKRLLDVASDPDDLSCVSVLDPDTNTRFDVMDYEIFAKLNNLPGAENTRDDQRHDPIPRAAVSRDETRRAKGRVLTDYVDGVQEDHRAMVAATSQAKRDLQKTLKRQAKQRAEQGQHSPLADVVQLPSPSTRSVGEADPFDAYLPGVADELEGGDW